MQPIAITTFSDRLLLMYGPPRRAASTRRQIGQVLREIMVDSKVKRTYDLVPDAICRWMDRHPKRTAVTWRSHLRCLRVICGHAAAMQCLRVSPFAMWRPGDWIRSDTGPQSKPRPAHREADEIARVLELADREATGGDWSALRLRAMVYLYAFTGMRAGEALHLWAEDIDLDQKVITIQAHREDGYRPKTLGSAAQLPIADPLFEPLSVWLPLCGCRWLFPGLKKLGPWTSGGPGIRPLDQVKELGIRAGVPGLTIASFRKTFATLAPMWGFDQLELQRWLRHSSAATQQWYIGRAVEVLRPSAKKPCFPRIVTAA